MAQVVKSPPANAGDLKGAGLISGLGRSPGEGNGNPLQYSCLENSMVRGTWWATVLGVSKSRRRLSRCWMMEKPSHQFLFFSIFRLLFTYLAALVSLHHMDFSSCCSWAFWLWHMVYLLHNMWDFSSLTRDQTHIPCIGRQILKLKYNLTMCWVLSCSVMFDSLFFNLFILIGG